MCQASKQPVIPAPTPAPTAAPTPAQASPSTLSPPRPRWYEGIESIYVDPDQSTIDRLASNCQFSRKRYALFFTASAPVDVKVGFYTAAYGTSSDPSAILVDRVSVPNEIIGGHTHNFFRTAEGLSVKQKSFWGTSQACALRRMHFRAGLRLSEYGDGMWSSGGFMADTRVEGDLDMGTQQQFLVRNSEIDWVSSTAGWNAVYVGNAGGIPESSVKVSNIAQTPVIAEKPYLVVHDDGDWFLVIPDVRSKAVGMSRVDASSTKLPLTGGLVCIARPGMSGHDINQCVAGKSALILAPGLYPMDEPIMVTEKGFVVLGLGYATLNAKNGRSCVVVETSAANAHVAGVMCDASQGHDGSQSTQALVRVKADGVILNDVFTRAGTWGGNTGESSKTISALRADVMLHVEGNGVVIDHLWAWVADHSTDQDDGCGVANGGWDVAALPQVKERVTVVNNGLVVDGNDVTAYCLMAEHTREHTVVWNGDRGATYMFQNELPYSGQKAGVRTWGPDQRAYKVTGADHRGYGLGAYVVVPNWEGDFNPMPEGEESMHYFFEAPGDARFDRLLGWNNAPGGYRTFLGDAVLLKGGQTFGRKCEGCAASGRCDSSPMQPGGFCYVLDCCARCADSSFCSPQSGRCYAEKKREYYETCIGEFMSA